MVTVSWGPTGKEGRDTFKGSCPTWEGGQPQGMNNSLQTFPSLTAPAPPQGHNHGVSMLTSPIRLQQIQDYPNSPQSRGKNCTNQGCAKSLQSCPTPWTAAHQAPLSMGFSRQGYWSGLPCPPPWDLPDPGIETGSLKSPALADGFLTTSASWSELIIQNRQQALFKCLGEFLHLGGGAFRAQRLGFG